MSSAPLAAQTRISPTVAQITLRLAQAGDADRLALIGRATFLESYADVLTGEDILLHSQHQHAPAMYTQWLTSPDSACCLAETATGAPVGYAVLCPPDLPVSLEAGDLELKRIYMLHRFQGQGTGGALLRWAVDEAKHRAAPRLLLGVYGRNDAAISFYRRHGLEVIGTRRFLVGTTLHDDLVLGIQV